MSLKNNYPTIMPSLAMDFVNCPVLSPRVTFSRSSSATRVNSIGLIETVGNNVPRFDYDPVTLAPKGLLIEELRTNLLTYSEQFENAAWTKSNSNVLTNLLTYSQEFDNAIWVRGVGLTVSPNTAISPDGSQNADTITANGSASTASIYYDNITVTASTSYTFSIYVKLGTLSASDYKIAVYNVTGSAFIAVDVTPTQVLNSTGWTRISYTFTTPVGCISARVYPYRNAATVTNATMYLYGAQLVQGTNPEEYTVTTSAPAPIQVMGPLGFLGAEKLVESATNALHYTYQGTTTLANTSYTLSVYCKASERTQAIVRVGGLGWAVAPSTTIDLSNGSVISGSGIVTSAGSGWYRISVNGVTDGTNASRGILIASTSNAAETYTGDGTSGIYIWGAQLEAGSFPTSYIPTTSAQVTRTADNASMTGTAFSSWYNQSEGTVAVEYDVILNTGSRVIFDIGAWGVFGTTIYGVQTGSYIGILPGTAPITVTSTVNTTSRTNKIATGLQNNSSTISVNTVLGTTDTSCTMPANATTLTIGCSQFNGGFGNFLNGHIKSFKYYPQRLSNAQLQTLSK